MSSRPLIAGLAVGAVAVTASAVWVAAPEQSVPVTGTSATAAAKKPLPFDLPSTQTLRASSKKVFAHYFTPYPRSLDNQAPANDYYARNYLNPAGESGKHRAYGGLLRDRPLPRQPLTGDWALADMESEIRTARAAGIDGFTVDLLNLDPASPHRKRLDLLVKAAAKVDPGFRVVLMPDMTATQIKSYSPAGLAAALATIAKSPSVYKLGDGRLVVSPFKAENRTPDWYKQFIAALKAKGVTTALVPVFLNFGANQKAFAPISYGFSNWGNRSPNLQGGVAGNVATAHAAGKIWMQPVAVQDERPNQKIFDEAGNTENLRTTWQNAINAKADWIQLTTWNDYSEGTQWAPSVRNGGAYLDLASYYLTRLKTGRWPAIVRDTVYLTHRTHLASAKPTSGGQTAFMVPRGGTLKPRDTVEYLTFLKSAATVRATVGGKVQDYAAQAGVLAKLFPLRNGGNAASVLRGGATVAKVTSPFAVTGSPKVQDLQYSAVTSGRQ